MSQAVRFRGFPANTWRKDEDATVLGYGIAAKGDVLVVDDDTAQWLLSNKAEWEEASEEAKDNGGDPDTSTDVQVDQAPAFISDTSQGEANS